MSATYNLQIRLSHHEYNAFARAAAKQAMEVSTWVRWAATHAASSALVVPVEELVPRRQMKGRSAAPATPSGRSAQRRPKKR